MQENLEEYSEDIIYDIYLKINHFTDLEMNDLTYNLALKKDQRTFILYYFSLIRTKHLLIFSFYQVFDYNSRTLKIFLFLFNFAINFFVNALFFDDATMHKIYEEKGAFNFIYNFPKIIYSSLISGIINALIKILALTDTNFIKLKKINDKAIIHEQAKNTMFIIKLKSGLFFIISLFLLTIFWIYLACFCAVYKNTQIHLIKDTLISFGTFMIYPLVIYLFPGIFRIIALKGKDKTYMFSFSKFLQLF